MPGPETLAVFVGVVTIIVLAGGLAGSQNKTPSYKGVINRGDPGPKDVETAI
jgi:hypothetical protein